MPKPGLQIYLRPPVTLIFDLLTPKVDRSMSDLSTWTTCAILASISVHSFSKYRVHNLVTDERTDGRTGWEHYVSETPPASLACRRDKQEVKVI